MENGYFTKMFYLRNVSLSYKERAKKISKETSKQDCAFPFHLISALFCLFLKNRTLFFMR